MSGIAEPMRECVSRMAELGWFDTRPDVALTLYQCADAIDAEHSRRMQQSRRDMRKAACKYMRSVLNDYQHGIKRERKGGRNA